jgi:hypothetical protein
VFPAAIGRAIHSQQFPISFDYSSHARKQPNIDGFFDHVPVGNLHIFDTRLFIQPASPCGAIPMKTLQSCLSKAPSLSDLTLYFHSSVRTSNSPLRSDWRFNESGGKIPAIGRLDLLGYDWPSASDAPSHLPAVWDLSKLQELLLEDVELDNFFGSVSGQELARVTLLNLCDRLQNRASRPLSIPAAVWKSMPLLTSLDIGRHWRNVLQGDSLFEFGPQLRQLFLNQRDSKHSQRWRWEQDVLSVDDLEKLHSAYPHLEARTQCY